MDSLANAAARALARGDPLGALQRVALRQDAAALALRGIAMAQLGELERSRELLRRAAGAFGPAEAVARARCVVAEAEVALAARDLTGQPRGLSAALRTLASRGDALNVWHGQLSIARRQLLLGHAGDAEKILRDVDWSGAPARLVALRELVAAELALRRLEPSVAKGALERAREAATRAHIPALCREIDHAARALVAPAARLFAAGSVRLVDLEGVARLRAGEALVVDACRRSVSLRSTALSLARRPVLFQLACALARAWPEDAARSLLIESAFGVRRANASHRARLRVEVSRLRAQLSGVAEIAATSSGFALRPRHGASAVVLAPPIDSEGAALVALLSDGAAWSTSALGLALGWSQRSVQRGLAVLEEAGQVRSVGRGRSQRWLAPSLSGFTTALLLPALPLTD
ncbi:MAG TPA: helix-turn-helix domain-containing protein [Polyangiaceae bacterium]|nr:helix-turn-helix domain-containing protein [Polyangiaceae bacterium]